MSKSYFISVPAYFMVPDGKGHWISRDSLIFHYDPLNINITVPPGSANDLASIPWFFRRVFPINGPSRPAAALHDYLYEKKGILPNINLTRKECDEIFLEAMKSTRGDFWTAYPIFVQDYLSMQGLNKVFKGCIKPLVDKTTAWLMYVGVRLGGWVSF